MHSAPAVSFPVGRSRFQAVVSMAAWLVAAVLCAHWFSQVDAAGWRQWLAAGMVCVVGALMVHAWRHASQGLLRWDGQVWWWQTSGGSETGVLTVHLDFQARMLLGLQGDSGVLHWLWLERSDDMGAWDALRRATFSRAGGTVGQAPDTHANFDRAKP